MKRCKLLFLLPFLLLLVNCNRDPKAARQRYVNNGNKYFDKGKYKEASIMYRKALQSDMRYGEAWYRLGLTNMKLGAIAEARRDFMRATDVDPNNLDAVIRLADVDLAAYLSNPKQNKPILADLKELIENLHKKDPNNYNYYRLSGYVALTNGDLTGALPFFEKANQIKPDQSDLVLTLTQTLLATGKGEEGERLAKDLIQKQKTFSPIYDVLYVYYARSNHPELAEQILKEKVANNPKEGAYLIQLAAHYFRTNHREEMTAALNRLTSDPKTFVNGHMQGGDFYFQIREYDAALQQYQKGRDEDSKNKVAYQKRMVEVLSTQGKPAEAAKVVAELLKEDSKDPESISMDAALMLQSGDKSKIKQVIAELQPLVVKTPNSAILHYNLARAYMMSGDPQNAEQARMHFEETLKLRSGYIPAKLGLAQLAVAHSDNAKAVQLCDEILAVDKNNLPAQLTRSMGLINLGEYDRAREQLQATTKQFPKSNDALYQIGLLGSRDKHWAEAEEALQELRNQHDTRGTVGLVEIKVAQGKFDEALAITKEQLRQTPNNFDFQIAQAHIEYKAERWNDAAADYQKLVDANPKNPDLYLYLGDSKRRAGDIPGAIAVFKKGHDVAPNQPGSLLQLGMVYSATGRDEEAFKAYEEVLRMQPDNPVALNNLAYEKADSGVDLDQALTYAQRAQQKSPNDINIMDTLGLIYIRKNLTDDGVRVLKDLVTRAPDRATFHLHLAQAYYQKGNRVAAKQELASASKTKPNDKEQAKIKELMAKLG